MQRDFFSTLFISILRFLTCASLTQTLPCLSMDYFPNIEVDEFLNIPQETGRRKIKTSPYFPLTSPNEAEQNNSCEEKYCDHYRAKWTMQSQSYSETASWRLYLLSPMIKWFFPKDFKDNADLIQKRDQFNYLMSYIPIFNRVKITPVNNKDICGEWIIPHETSPVATILYLHGGGFCFGSPNTHRPYLAYLAEITSTKIFTLDYRLAPENPFPAALDDAVNAYLWLLSLGENPERIFIGGDSAGGGLTMSLLLRLKDEQNQLPLGAFCLSPWLDLSHQGNSFKENEDKEIVLKSSSLVRAAHLYAGNNDISHPYISPIFGHLRGLPPLFLQVSSSELLFSDSQRLAQSAQDQDVQVTYDVWHGTFHAWPTLAPYLPESKAAVEKLGEFIKTLLGTELCEK